MRPVYVPDESEERLALAQRRRSRMRLATLSVLLLLAVVAYLAIGPWRETRRTLADGFRSEVVPTVPIIGPADSAWAARRAPFRILVSTVQTREQASTIATALRVDGLRVEVAEDSVDHRFRVEVGPYVHRSEAEEVARGLRSGYGAGVMLIERQ
jgi:hypothetical protein